MRGGKHVVRIAAVALLIGCTHSADLGPEARRAACEKYVAVLSGHTNDPALLDDARLHALAGEVPDLVMCGAVLAGSDVLCLRFLPKGHGPSSQCRHTTAIFRALRDHPRGRAFMFEDYDREECGGLDIVTAAECDAFQVAARAGDPALCVAAGLVEPICRAFIALDPSLCRVDDAKLQRLGVEQDCRKAIETRGFLRVGLQALGQSGREREAAFARATLGDQDACAPFIAAAVKTCIASDGPPS